MLLAEGRSLDDLVFAVHVFFVCLALPGVGGFLLARDGGRARVGVFVLGLFSVLAGAGVLGWVTWEHSTVPSFYLAAGTPLVVGMAACWRAWRLGKKPDSRT